MSTKIDRQIFTKCDTNKSKKRNAITASFLLILVFLFLCSCFVSVMIICYPSRTDPVPLLREKTAGSVMFVGILSCSAVSAANTWVRQNNILPSRVLPRSAHSPNGGLNQQQVALDNFLNFVLQYPLLIEVGNDAVDACCTECLICWPKTRRTSCMANSSPKPKSSTMPT